MSNESYTVTGKLYKKNPMEVKSEKLSIQNLIIHTTEDYPQYLQIQATNKAIPQLAGVNEGDTLKLTVNVQGRLWKNPQGDEICFNTLSLYKCEVLVIGSQPQQQAQIQTHKADVMPSSAEDESDPLPF